MRTNFTFWLVLLLLAAANPGCQASRDSTPRSNTGRVVSESARFREKLRQAEAGDVGAQYAVGKCYAEGQGVARDSAAAAQWYRKAAEQGDVAAQGSLGICLFKGIGVEYNAEEAVKWLRKAAEQGHAEAQTFLGLAYLEHRGVAEYYAWAKAQEWFEKAAKQGEAKAQGLLLGLAYLRDVRAGKQGTDAGRELRKAAEQGNAVAQTSMGLACLQGAGVTQNHAEAAKWFLKAAAQQNATAQFQLARAYFEGQGVAKNDRKAVEWCRQAAEAGHPAAQQILSSCYQEGRGVRRNPGEAWKWLRKSADQGDATAEAAVGLAYRDGEGVATDYVQAYKWLDRAALHGDSDATAARGELLRHMTAEQWAQAGAVPRPWLRQFDVAFTQSAGSCVMSTYAIAANYFTGVPVSAYFEGYCRHFGLPYTDALDAERKYSRHFDAEWKKRQCLGCEVILDLHSNATEQCFVEARRRFDAQLFRETAAHAKELEQTLRARTALLHVGIAVEGSAHALTVFADGPELFVRDSNFEGFHTISGLESVGKLLDSVLYIAK